MDYRYPEGRLEAAASPGENEYFGLINDEKDDASIFSDVTEQYWNHPRPQPPKPRKSWLRVMVVTLLIAWTLGFIIHSFVVPHKYQDSQARKAAQLRPEKDYILDPSWDFEAPPRTREYTWTISEHTLNPDGVFRPMLLINGTFPGPLIECNEGDEIVVHVQNRSPNATSIHWHGLFQNGTNWMDGAVGVTQCPIAPGQDFTYRFRVDGQSGTYYYHSHMGVQLADGLVGPLVIHPRGEDEEEKRQKIPYDVDRVVMVSDYYYDLSAALAMQYLAPGSENEEPVPPSALINGRNVRDCGDVPGRNCSSTDRARAVFDLPSDVNTRLRFINVGAFAEFSVRIDDHELHVSEVDGTDVFPQAIHRLNVLPAQRYSIIIVPPKEDNKGLYWLRARMITHCFAYEDVEMIEDGEVRGVLRYWAPGGVDAGTGREDDDDEGEISPNTKDWDEIIDVECRDLNTSALEPVIHIPAPENVDDTIYLRTTFQIRDWRLSRAYLNDSSFRANITSPILARLLTSPPPSSGPETESNNTSHGPINSHLFNPKTELVYQVPTRATIDVLIQNLDDGAHPFHLHGHTFFVLASGHGYVPENLTPTLHLENPLRRDTAAVEAFGWLLVRFVADNAGIWALHCHNAWHMEAGMGMVVAVGEAEMRGWDIPEEVGKLCEADGIEKGKGPNDGIWEGVV